MLDAMKVGGVTGWLRASSLAAAQGLRVSNHLWPELSVQLLSVTPTAHWLEYADWWNPILQDPLEVQNGMAIPGPPIEWKA
jgi:mandelate racemase